MLSKKIKPLGLKIERYHIQKDNPDKQLGIFKRDREMILDKSTKRK